MDLHLMQKLCVTLGKEILLGLINDSKWDTNCSKQGIYYCWLSLAVKNTLLIDYLAGLELTLDIAVTLNPCLPDTKGYSLSV